MRTLNYNDVIDTVRGQLPERLADQVSLSLRSDAFGYACWIDVRFRDNRTFELRLQPDNKLLEADVSRLCLLR